MKHLTRKTAAALGALAVAAAIASTATAQDYMKPGEGVTIQPTGPGFLRTQLEEEVVIRGLKELGYDVKEPLHLKYALMFLSVAGGDADYAAGYAHPLHQAFFDKAGGDAKLKMTENALYGPMPSAYYVDKASYDAGIRSIEDLKDPENAARFDIDADGKADLVGCQPGWGCERAIEHHMDAYELRDHVTHLQGEYAVLIADVVGRVNNDQPVLYYAWRPYWVNNILKQGVQVERLEVPFTSVGDDPSITAEQTTVDGKNLGHLPFNRHLIANKEFLANNPAAATYLELANIPIEDIENQRLLIYQGEKQPDDIERHISTWMSDNRDKVDSWLNAARDAAQAANN